jgi:hypothetical protein
MDTEELNNWYVKLKALLKQRKLKIWNGRPYCCHKPSDKRWSRSMEGHAYVCARTREEARRVIEEYCGIKPSANELRDYWSDGCWGDAMVGIEPECGLWISFGRDKPVRVV